MLAIFICSLAFAQDFAGTGWRVNESLRADSGLEIAIKSTAMADADSGLRMREVEFGNIERLYQPRGNPYPGQVTDVIACEEKYKARVITIHVAGSPVKALTGGASGRKAFGACTKSRSEYWGGYFNFALEGHVFEVRAFLKVARGRAALEKILNQIVVRAGA